MFILSHNKQICLGVLYERNFDPRENLNNPIFEKPAHFTNFYFINDSRLENWVKCRKQSISIKFDSLAEKQMKFHYKKTTHPIIWEKRTKKMIEYTDERRVVLGYTSPETLGLPVAWGIFWGRDLCGQVPKPTWFWQGPCLGLWEI